MVAQLRYFLELLVFHVLPWFLQTKIITPNFFDGFISNLGIMLVNPITQSRKFFGP